MKLGFGVREPRLRPLRPAPTAPGEAPEVARPLVLVSVEDSDGAVGHGEAAPLPDYDGVTLERVLTALERYRPVLSGSELPAELANPKGARHAEIIASCAALDPLPQALAAVDLALWDLAGQRAGQPVWALLGAGGGGEPEPVRVNATIGSVAPREAAAEALTAAAAGFRCIKVKVGTPDDRQRLAAIREAVGTDMLLRVDANGAWTRLDAPERIRALSRFDVELFEEPVHGQDAIAAVSRLVPESALALDESARRELGTFAQRYCDAVCLKIAASGGISGLLKDASAARAVGYEVYVASTLDGPLGIAAALHAAAVIGPDRHCGLATLGRLDREPPLVAVGGRMAVPGGAGLGDGLLGWYET